MPSDLTAETEISSVRRSMEMLGLAVFWVKPDDGQVVFANRAAQKLLDCSEQALLGESFCAIDAAFETGGWSEFVAKLRQAGAVERETVLLPEPKRYLSVALNASLIDVGGEEVIIYFARQIGDGSAAERAVNAQLELITDSLPILIARVDRNLRYTFVNKGYERVFGRGGLELVGRTMREVLGESDLKGSERYIKRVLLGETVTFEHAFYRTALGKRVIRGTFSPDTSEDGQIVGYFALGQDITSEAGIREEHELSEARAESAKSQLLGAIESLSAGFALFDPDERLVICNTRLRAAFPLIESHIKRGAKFEDMVRRYAETVESLLNDTAARDSFVAKRLKFYRNSTGNLVYSAPDGMWYRMTDHRTPDGGGVIIHTDITESKIREMQLLEAKNQADSVNRIKTEFLANMSHELRTPLNAIIGFSEIIEHEMFGPISEPKYVEYISDIKRSGVHLLDVINDILDISKVESGTVVLDQDLVEIGEIIQTCHRLVTPRVQEKSLLLATEITEGVPVFLGDRRRITQLLLNLLSNAIKFTADGGHIVTCVTCGDAGEVELSVRDSGIGIRAENLARAVEPFFQVDGTLARPHEGTGLGLTLCKMFAELHGGSLEIASEFGAGTTVTARFPANIVQDVKTIAERQVAEG